MFLSAVQIYDFLIFTDVIEKAKHWRPQQNNCFFFNLLKEIALFVKQLSLLHLLDVKSFIVVMIYIVR